MRVCQFLDWGRLSVFLRVRAIQGGKLRGDAPLGEISNSRRWYIRLSYSFFSLVLRNKGICIIFEDFVEDVEVANRSGLRW